MKYNATWLIKIYNVDAIHRYYDFSDGGDGVSSDGGDIVLSDRITSDAGDGVTRMQNLKKHRPSIGFSS